MSEQIRTIRVQGPSHIGLIVEVEAPDLSRKEAIKRWLALGNSLLDTDGDKLIAVNQIEEVHYEAVDGEFVWACDYCGKYSRWKEKTEAHEKECKVNYV